MLKTNGFVDLRIGHGATGIGDDSVWPSFTDIMTVIVMIFLMTLVVIMVRNFGLSSELLTNITAREAVMLANQDLLQKNTELEASLESAETERTSLSMSLTQALDRIASLSEHQVELLADLESVNAVREELEQANVRLQQAQLETSAKVEGLTADTADLQTLLQRVEAERSSLTESLTQAREQIATLINSESGLQEEVALLAAARDDLTQQKADLEVMLENVEAERSSLTESLTQAREQIATLINSESGLQEEVALLAAARDDLTQQKADLEVMLENVEAERVSLAESLAQALQQVASLTEIERKLQDELVELTASELLLTRNIGSLDETLAELKMQSEAEIASLIDERTTLEDRIYTLSEQLEHLRRLLSRSTLENQLLTEEMAQVERVNESAAERYARVTDEILALQELIEQREVEIAALRASADTSAQQYQSLQEEYESLDAQYRKLIRPARSPVGKTVAEVRVEKISGTLSYSIKRPDDPGLAPVSRDQLDAILEDLKNRLGKSLYTRIVIPDDSNLTFNEAWGFTWEILQKYDYYYQ